MKPFALSDIPVKHHAAILAQLHPEKILAGRLRNAQPEQNAKLLSLGKDENEKGSTGRFRVCIERRGAKLLDADNLAGSCKWLVDALRYGGHIPDDSPECIVLEITQVKTPRKEDRGTLIEIYPLGSNLPH